MLKAKIISLGMEKWSFFPVCYEKKNTNHPKYFQFPITHLDWAEVLPKLIWKSRL